MPERLIGGTSIAREHFGRPAVPSYFDSTPSFGDVSPLSVGSLYGMRFRESKTSLGSGSNQGQLNERMLTIQEAAYKLHVHANTVRRWSNSGQLRAYRIGRRGDRRFKQEDILRFLEHTSEEPSAGADVQVDLTQ